MNFRIGCGIDVHRLENGLGLTLGGVSIPHYKGLVAHSDGDVLIHSLCDALLGAANLRDIGFHFPDTSSEFKGIDSKLLLQKTISLLKDKNYKVVNTDSTLCLQKPKIMLFIPQMQETLAKIMGVDPDDVSIKATTTEKLGYEGREEGVSAYSVCLILKNG